MSRRIAILLGALWFAVCLLVVPGARAQSTRYTDIALGDRGLPVPNVNVGVCGQPSNTNTQPCSPLASLYVDSTRQSYSIVASTGAVRSSGVVTITTTVANSISPGQTVAISGVTDPTFNGTVTVLSSGGSQFSYTQAGANATSGGGSVSAANPLTADTHGNYFFYAPPGKYTVQIYGPAVFGQIVQRDVLLACDSSNCTITGGTITGTAFDISQNTLKTATNTAGHYPRNNGTQYVDTTIQAGDMPVFVASGGSHAPGAVPDPGSVAGALRFLREDATFQQAPQIVYSTVSASTGASISATTMATAGASGNTYRFSAYIDQTAAGSGCTTNTTVNVLAQFVDAQGGVQQQLSIGNITIANNGAVPSAFQLDPGQQLIRSVGSGTVAYLTVYTQGSCTTGPKYQLYPILELSQ